MIPRPDTDRYRSPIGNRDNSHMQGAHAWCAPDLEGHVEARARRRAGDENRDTAALTWTTAGVSSARTTTPPALWQSLTCRCPGSRVAARAHKPTGRDGIPRSVT